MISRVYSMTINMNHPELSDIPIGDMVYVQGDTGINGMKITLTSGNPEQPIDLTGCLVTVTAQRSDGHLAEKMLTKVDTPNGEVEWEMDKEDLSVPGMVTVSVQIYDGLDGRLSSEEFEYEVVASLTTDDELYSSTQYDLYVNARHCGSYVNTTRYFMNNIVEYAGASYMALRDTQGQPPPSLPDLSNAYWHLLSQRGSTGWKGTYDDYTSYGVGDMVEHLGSSWICVQACAGQAPPDTPAGASEHWNLLARIGAVSSVNGQVPDSEGNVLINLDYLVQTVNGVPPDSQGNAQINIGHIATPHIDYAPPPDCISATLTAAGWSHGTSISAASPSTDITGGTDNKLKISVDDDTAEEITLSLTNCNSGEDIASELQTRIQALGGNKSGVTVQYDGVYIITSPTNTAKSAVVITDGSAANIADDLKLGTANGGVEANGGAQTINHEAIYNVDAPGDIKIAENASDEEFMAWVYALPRKKGQEEGSITVRILGDVPAVDIPVELEVR